MGNEEMKKAKSGMNVLICFAEDFEFDVREIKDRPGANFINNCTLLCSEMVG